MSDSKEVPSDVDGASCPSRCSPSPDLLFTFDEEKNVIRLADGSEIPGDIIHSIDIRYPDEPTNEYEKWKPTIAVEALIQIKDGWLWDGEKTVYASVYRVR